MEKFHKARFSVYSFWFRDAGCRLQAAKSPESNFLMQLSKIILTLYLNSELGTQTSGLILIFQVHSFDLCVEVHRHPALLARAGAGGLHAAERNLDFGAHRG